MRKKPKNLSARGQRLNCIPCDSELRAKRSIFDSNLTIPFFKKTNVIEVSNDSTFSKSSIFAFFWTFSFDTHYRRHFIQTNIITCYRELVIVAMQGCLYIGENRTNARVLWVQLGGCRGRKSDFLKKKFELFRILISGG